MSDAIPTTAPVVVRLSDDPAFTALLDDLDALPPPRPNAVLEFSAVTYVNSSNLGRLLQSRKRAVQADRRVVLCNVPVKVQAILVATSLTQVFEIAPDEATATARLVGPRS